MLEQNGYDTLTALGGIAGVAVAIAQCPGVIILDLLMPDLNGFDVVRQLRSRPDTAEIPILILTAKDLTPEDRLQLRQSVQGIVSKGGRDTLLSELARIGRRVVVKR
jgi:CheY-like chemotaxis protein